MQPLTVLTVVPLVFSVIGIVFNIFPDVGFLDLGGILSEGIANASKTAIMLLFAILYFSLMLDVGLFDPLINWLLKRSGGDPVKIYIATALVGSIVSMGGDGTTTTLVMCATLLPVFRKLNLSIMNFAVILISMNSIFNLLPWGGPTARVVAMSGVDDQTLLRGLAPGMAVATVYVFIVAYFFGKKERQRNGIANLTEEQLVALAATDEETASIRRPKLVGFNLILTLVILALLLSGVVESVVLFLVGFIIALLVNYRDASDQTARVAENAGDALLTSTVFMSAGVFMGIFNGTGMADAIAVSLIEVLPAAMGEVWGLLMAIVSGFGSFLIANDAFYYGVFPVLAEAGYQFGWTPVEMGVSALFGQAFHQLSPLVPFIYLLLNKTGLNMGDWQRESVKVLAGVFLIYVVVAALTGAVPLYKP